MNNNTILFFLHVPKAAGTTLHAILEKHYANRETYTIDGLRVRESIETFKGMSPAELRGIRLVKGHMPFGLHAFTPSPARYITFLRNPVERAVSYYYYVKRSPAHYLHRKVVDNDMSLAGFVQSRLTTELYDFQVKLLAGEESALHSWNYDDTLLELARENIDRYFAVVGFTEYFDHSLLLLRDVLGWRSWPLYRKKNVTRGRTKIDMIDKNVVKIINNENRLDCMLYEETLTRFKAELDRAGITNSRVLFFRLVNRLYNAATLEGVRQSRIC